MPEQTLLELMDAEGSEREGLPGALVEKADARSLRQLTKRLLDQRQRLKGELAKALVESAQARAVLERLEQPPFFPALVVRPRADGRADVLCGGRRQIVNAVPELDAGAFRPGEEVLLSADGSAVVARSEGVATGAVARVDAIEGERVLLRTASDEELVVSCAPDLARQLEPGARVTYAREAGCVLDPLPERERSEHLLEHPPAVSFADVGGLDGLIDDVRSDLELHLLHRSVAERYGLSMLRGITFVGPPGVGKTLLASAIAHHLAELAPGTRLLEVKPGALRAQYYGQTEARIRELFALARRSPELVVMCFDELDTFGTRGEGIGQEIDGRVLGALLAELNGIQPLDRVLCIGATNRLDLIDTALIREGRFGDRIYEIPRPGRGATRQILGRLLAPQLPYAGDGDPAEAGAELAEAATSYLHAPGGGAGPVARLVYGDGREQEVRAPQVLSGALLAGGVAAAKQTAARRALAGGAGLALDDLIAGLDDALDAEARKLSAPHVAQRVLAVERALELVRVTIPPERQLRRNRYLRAA